MGTAAVQAEIQLTDESALGVRVVVSPLLTLAMSLLDALGDRPSTPWREVLRERGRGLDPGPLSVFALPSATLPNSLLPLPPSPRATFADELEALRGTRHEVLLGEIRLICRNGPVPPALAPFTTDTADALERYCDALAVYWDRLLRPSWPLMRRMLEREVLMLGHTLAVDGLATALRNLHPRLAYEDGTLRYRSGQAIDNPFIARTALTLAPVAGGPDLILANEDHPRATVIGYCARGAAELWEEGEREPAAELAALLGATRASIALALATPATTTGLAERLRLAPSTVSRHLAGLTATGLAYGSRRGPSVDYRLTDRGTALLDLFRGI